ncbi:uncharacterized protein METZ01_LOCUS490575 [marine metagenome]|uniref:Uncharacterized protein n=1 Tax=marine metagenome TaxID=408172 RepID=A0A383CZX0_9ZZZZ
MVSVAWAPPTLLHVRRRNGPVGRLVGQCLSIVG